MRLMQQRDRAHNIEKLASRDDVPQPIVDAWLTFRHFPFIYAQTTPAFQPSLEVEAHSFTAFVYRNGGVPAVEWLGKHRIINRKIVRRFLSEVS